ncbi:MAG: hypothetical protein IPJ94_02060 [Chloroflexi bacterium]|nr:hypothetical protein [Chloroflexota bacterium]
MAIVVSHAVEQDIRYQVQVKRDETAIEWALFRAGWRRPSAAGVALTEAVLAYRDQYIEENIFRRLKGKMLSIRQRETTQGLFHLLVGGLLALAITRLAAPGRPTVRTEWYLPATQAATARPTMERLLGI